ncbi:MAG: hypothetical protein ACK40O_00895 [Allosphingosinicella sp.]
MAESTAEGATSRPKKPAGWYSKAQRQQRREQREARRQAREEAAAKRAIFERVKESRLKPLRELASRRAVEASRERAATDAAIAIQAPAPKRARLKRDRRSEVQRLIDARAERARVMWAKRQPKAAAAERQLRKERSELEKRWDHKNNGTRETHEHASRRNQGAIAQLYQNGTIDGEQLAAAVEIAAVAERIGADVAVRTASLETRVDRTRMGDGTFYERLGQVRREMAYTRWRAQVRGPIAAVLEMIVGDHVSGPIGFTIVARRYRMGNRRAKRLLIDALDLWPRILGGVCKEVDDATLAAAHAGIL